MGIGRKSQRILCVVSTSVLTGALMLPQADAVEVGVAGKNSMFLNVGTGAAVERPVLDEIERSAEAKGVPLEEAIDSYISGVESSSPPSPETQPDGPVDTPDVVIDDLTAGQLEDIRAMADGEGIPLAEAIDRYGWQDQFTAVAESLESTYPEEFSGAVKSDTGAWFAFKGKAPDEAVELARTIPAQVEVVSNRGFSEADLAQAQQNAHSDVMAQSGVASAVSAYDVKAGEVNVEVKLSETLVPGAARAATEKRVTSSQADLGGGIPVNVAVTGGGTYEKQDGYTRGGGYLSVGCTSGFNLKYLTSDVKRIGTAGHCTTVANQTYSNHSAQGGSTGVTTAWTHQGAWGDLGYTSIGSLASSRTFYQDYNNVRYADDRAAMPAVGTQICKFGRTSGKTCSTVKYRDVSVSTLKHMVVMNGNACKPGDSGGPWYYGGTAYGIHTGLTNYDGTKRCLFTPAYLFQNRSYDVWTR